MVRRLGITALAAMLYIGAAMAQSEQIVYIDGAKYTVYTVAKGDTLYGICVRFYGNLHRAKEICELNNIEDMNNILYGQKILLPQ